MFDALKLAFAAFYAKYRLRLQLGALALSFLAGVLARGCVG